MINFQQYIQESTIYEDLLDCYIFEENELIFPTNGKYSPFRIKYGDHTKQRGEERKVKKKEIIDTIFKAKSQLINMVKDGTLKVSHHGQDPYTFVIADATKDPEHPLSVVGFIGSTRKNNKEMTIIVKTVARYKNFSALKRKDTEHEKHIFLY